MDPSHEGRSQALAEEADGRQTILIVDDDADIREALRRTFAAHIPDLRIVLAGDAQEGMRVLAEAPIDLVVSDFRMPGMDGVEFLVWARAQFPGTSRILMTAFPDIDVATRAINDGGVQYFLAKPIAPDTAISVAKFCLAERQKEAPTPTARTWVVKTVSRERAPHGEEMPALAERLRTAEGQIARLKVKFGLGKISGGTFQNTLAELEQRRAELEYEILSRQGDVTARY